jgi:hypothetical protein
MLKKNMRNTRSLSERQKKSHEKQARDQSVLKTTSASQAHHQRDRKKQVKNSIGSVMASVIVSSAIGRRFELRPGQNKDYEIGMCCFSAKDATLRRKTKTT